MTNSSHRTVTIGDLVETAYGHAETLAADANEARDLATRTVARWLARAERLDLIRKLGGQSGNDLSSLDRPTLRTRGHARAA